MNVKCLSRPCSFPLDYCLLFCQSAGGRSARMAAKLISKYTGKRISYTSIKPHPSEPSAGGACWCKSKPLRHQETQRTNLRELFVPLISYSTDTYLPVLRFFFTCPTGPTDAVRHGLGKTLFHRLHGRGRSVHSTPGESFVSFVFAQCFV
jgi:hypothetical protein